MGYRFFAPEILQVSTMDCGIAALSCMLSAYGVQVDYDKLRQACQTQVDGTSIDALEDIANDFSLDISQHVVPPDIFEEAMDGRYPLVALIALGPGMRHFATVWRKIGDRLQVMDPRGGRVWPLLQDFLGDLYSHTLVLDVEQWHAWFGDSSFADALRARARRLLSATAAAQCDEVIRGADPLQVGALDAALRLVAITVKTAGGKSRSWCDELFSRAFRGGVGGEQASLPSSLWTIAIRGNTVLVRGAVFLGPARAFSDRQQAKRPDVGGRGGQLLGDGGTPTLALALARTLGPKGLPPLLWVLFGTLLLSLSSAVELVLYRAAIDLPTIVSAATERVWAASGLAIFFACLFALEWATSFLGNRLGRTIELRLRAETLWSIPRVDDEFVRSRPTSDLANRAHALSQGGLVMATYLRAGRDICDLTVTLLAMSILDVRYLGIVLVGGALFVGLALAFRNKLLDVDTRLQVHSARLLVLLLDALRGVRPLRIHGYEDSFRDEQRREIAQWKGSAREQINVNARLESAFGFTANGILVVLFWCFMKWHSDARAFVLLAFWSFRIPPIIESLMRFAQSHALQKNAVMRLLEVTRYAASDDEDPAAQAEIVGDPQRGLGLRLDGVTVDLLGKTVLDDVTLDIPAGQHVAVVGTSGSGKSTLVQLLLGIHRHIAGRILCDGVEIEQYGLDRLRAETMWIDPAIQLWNASLNANFEYAARGYPRRAALNALEDADLLSVLASLERGLDTPVGAEGAFVSGGEGQRIRIGRGLLRAGTRIAILDEPFRGLDRATRQRLLSQIRRSVIRSTMIFVSHDISHALTFDRVLVVDGGRIVEDGSPQELSTQPSVFARMLAAEREVLDRAWSAQRWRRLRIAKGRVEEVDQRA